MIESTDRPDVVRLLMSAKPASAADRILGIHHGRLNVAVAAPAEGKANAALRKLLAKALGVSRARVELERGDTSSTVSFLIGGPTATQPRARLAAMPDSVVRS